MKIYKLKSINRRYLERIKKRSLGVKSEYFSVVKKAISLVKEKGDGAIVKKYRKRYGKKYQIEVSPKEVQRAYEIVDQSFLQALRNSMQNITAVHRKQLSAIKSSSITVLDGITIRRKWRAIDKVGLYIPGGKAIYPSSVLMSAIPAQIAGCKEIIMCTPPDQKGSIPPPTLVAADMIGIKKIYKVGGAEAIAAMAFGTNTIPKVYKIFGAGNSYVTEAKMQVFGEVAIDMPAGPSEVFVVADETANPAFIAADLLADGEHGEDSACVLITTSDQIAKQTIQEIKKQLPKLSTKARARESIRRYGLFAIVDSLDEAIEFTNEYAPEHLEIMTRNPKNLVKKIINAGSVFLGDWTTKSAGDYATGANHVLPTGGMAKMFPSLSIESFGKMMQI